MLEQFRIPIETPGAGSYLLVRLAQPENEASPGLCLVFLHGFASVQEGTKARFFRERATADGLAFCTFDAQGHGESGGSIRDLTVTRFIEDFARVVDALKQRSFSRFVAIGSSMGGFAALWFAVKHPGVLAAACHVAPGFEMLKGFSLWAGPERFAQWEREGFLHVANETAGVDLGWGFIADLRQYGDDALAEQYATPTLLLHGCRDETIPWRYTARFAAQCRSGCVDVHLFGDGDHRLTDKKELMWKKMRDFLRETGTVASP